MGGVSLVDEKANHKLEQWEQCHTRETDHWNILVEEKTQVLHIGMHYIYKNTAFQFSGGKYGIFFNKRCWLAIF